MLGNVDGAFCLRAFCNKPRGVEDGVMEAESDVLRSEGILGVFEGLEGLEESSEGLPNGDSSSSSSSSSVDSGDRGLVAKSFESSGASGG